jgi:hypothetical protein
MLPIIYAALCKAVAAAALRKACDFASASFFAQSGRTISVVMTVLSFTASEVALLLPPGDTTPDELSEVVEDIAEAALFKPWL